jgi:tetratricopeptide (TPR) repeat protein
MKHKPTQIILLILVLALSSTAGFGQTPFPVELEKAEAASLQKQWPEAAAAWSRVVKANPHVAEYWRQLGFARFWDKDYRGSIKAYEQATELGLSKSIMAYNIAVCYGALGEKQKAFEWVERSLNLGYPRPQRMLQDANLQLLRENPRFLTLLGGDDVSKLSRVDGWRYDLDLFVRELNRIHPNPYRQTKREDFEAYVRRLRADVPRLNDEQVAVGMMKLAAMASDGHTSLRPAFLTGKGRTSLPLMTYDFIEGLYVVATVTQYKDLLGAQILRVGDHTIEQVIAACAPVVSRDNEMGVKLEISNLLRSPQLLYGLGLIPEPDKVPLTVRDAEGKERSVTIAGVTKAPTDGISLLSLTPDPLPISMDPRGGNYWFEYLPKEKTVYFQYNVVRNDSKESLSQFCERLFKFIEEHDVEKLAIDLTQNSGGDGNLNAILISALLRSQKVNQTGRLFVIIGRTTFSAAMALTGQFERMTKANFVGEPSGSSLNAIGEMNPMTLPYSKMSGGIASVGGGNYLDTRTWIAPQLYTPPSFQMYRAKRDPALEAIFAYSPKDK